MVVGTIISYEDIEDASTKEKLRKIRENHARSQTKDYSHVFREKSRLNLMRLSCVIIGVEFSYAVETAFVSPLLLELGIEHQHMSLIWSLPPVIGFILAPILGSWSDRCRLPWGRRRPLILILSTTLLAGLILVAWGRSLGALLGDRSLIESIQFAMNDENSTIHMIYHTDTPTASTPFTRWAVIFTIIGSVLLDFGSDNCQTPARTYLLDMCVSQDHTKGLSLFTVMAGFGAFVGYILGGINWEETQIGVFMGGNVKTVFTIVCIVLVITCTITLTSYREIPLALIEKDPLLTPISAADINYERNRENSTINQLTQNFFLVESQWSSKSHRSINASVLSLAAVTPPERITFRKYLKSIWIMPQAMKILCITNLLAWMGNTCYSLYFTDFVGESVFLGDPMAPVGSTKFLLYQAGLRYGSWGMAIFALSCAIHSMTTEKLIQAFGIKAVNICGLFSFSIGMLVLGIFPTKWGVLLLSVSTGIMYSTIFTIPYLLMANYHTSGIFKTVLDENTPLKQPRGLGTDMAILSSMMFIAQIIIALTIGPFITLIGSINAVIYASSFLSFCATIASSKVMYYTNE